MPISASNISTCILVFVRAFVFVIAATFAITFLHALQIILARILIRILIFVFVNMIVFICLHLCLFISIPVCACPQQPRSKHKKRAFAGHLKEYEVEQPHNELPLLLASSKGADPQFHGDCNTTLT